MKSLDQLDDRTPISILPYTITQGGSYYLTKNLGPPGEVAQNGITVNASNVSIDLNGFWLSGSGTSIPAIGSTGSAHTNIAIRNGTIDGWGAAVEMFDNSGVSVQNIRAVNNKFGGIAVGAKSLVASCTAIGNGIRGIKANHGSAVSNCVVAGTTGESNGFVGNGIQAFDGCLVVDSVVRETAGAGGSGINVGNGSSIVRCAVSLGSGDNLDGIDTGTACKVMDSSVYDNNGAGSDGIVAADGTVVSGCTISGNGGDGLLINSNCVVQNNNSSTNSAAGIRVTGSRSRIESNHAIGNGTAGFVANGLLVTKNLIIRNTAGSNPGGDYFIGPGNANAPIVSTANVGGNANPHANFELD